MLICFCSMTLIFALTIAQIPANASELFPFVLSYDAPKNVVNIAHWLEKPAGKGGFVKNRAGHFATDTGPIRFWGSNLCFDACFPSHAQAERVAARLATIGVNCIRMHHMDARSIWGSSPNKLTIDPAQIERLDYLIYQLKQHGIYTDLNLHVSRTLGEKEGFVAAAQRPKYDKGLDNFEPRMIEAQKKYARDLLTHVNPYTKTPYTHEPAIAVVEINNENALFNGWTRQQMDALPEPYQTTYRNLWNAWLRDKYGNTRKLREVWGVGSSPLQDEMLSNGDFENQLGSAWTMERDAETDVTWTVAPDGPDNAKCVRVVVKRQGAVSWHPQFSQSGLKLVAQKPYTLTCWLRSDTDTQIGLNCKMAHAPWQTLGLSARVSVGAEWKSVRLTFLADRDESNARITVTDLKPGTYELAKVSLRPGGILGLTPGQSLEDNSVPVLQRGQTMMTKAAQQDFVDFICDTERSYWDQMYHFLKEELHVQSLVSGTQLGYSPVSIQARCDYIDAHSYWQHPSFPGRPWDSNNWFVRNIALVNSPGGTLSRLANRRVVGMPYTVSEYNHPAPLSYAAEGFPMIAAMAAFQAWDGVFSFAYCHNTDFEPHTVSSYFDIKGDTAKIVHMPACHALFVRGDMSEAQRQVTVSLSPERERDTLHETLTPWSLSVEQFGVGEETALLHRVGLDLHGSNDDVRSSPPAPSGERNRFVSDTGQLQWDVSQPEKGYFIADTTRTKLFTGFVAGRKFELGDVRLSIGETRLDWATVSIVCLDGKDFASAGRILIAATGLEQNTGAQLEELGDTRVTLRRQWGTEPLLCEGIPAEITLPVDASRVRAYPLDEAGNRRSEIVAVKPSRGKSVITLSPSHRTVWYEVEIR